MKPQTTRILGKYSFQLIHLLLNDLGFVLIDVGLRDSSGRIWLSYLFNENGIDLVVYKWISLFEQGVVLVENFCVQDYSHL